MHRFYLFVMAILIALAGNVSFVAAATTTCSQGTYTVTVSTASIRASASTHAPQVAIVHRNTLIPVTQGEDGTPVTGNILWCKVWMSNDQVGYIHSSLLVATSGNPVVEPVQVGTGLSANTSNSAQETSTACTPGTYTVHASKATVRADSTTSASQLAILPYNTAVQVIGVVDGTAVSGNTNWCQVSMATDTSGYIHSSLLAAAPSISSADPIQPNTLTSIPIPSTSSDFNPPPVVSNPSGGILCVDGWISYAAHRQGACSHHGGIAPGH